MENIMWKGEGGYIPGGRVVVKLLEPKLFLWLKTLFSVLFPKDSDLHRAFWETFLLWL